MTAKLIAEEGELEGLVLSFDDGEEWIIGRDPDTCQLVVEDPDVSNEHLVARRQDDGIALENLSSTNPALVNDDQIEGSLMLEHGDAVRIGGGIFRFYTEIGGQQMGKSADAPKAEKRGTKAAVEEEEEEDDDDAADDTLFEDEADDQEQLLADIDFDLSETGRWLLKVIAGPNNGAEFSMEPGLSYVLGTDSSKCDIVFHDVSVSRQHAKISIGNDNQIKIADLKSRNGILVDEKKIKGKSALASKSVVSLGTTSFIVFDREADRDTIITPLLPSIVKSLKGDAPAAAQATPQAASAPESPKQEPETSIPKTRGAFGRLVVLGLVVGLFAIIGMGTTSLFRSQEITVKEIDTEAELEKVMMQFPTIKYTFSPSSGKLLLIGHVQKNVDKAQLKYNLQGLTFIRDIDDTNLVIDEYVVQQTNITLARNPVWHGVSLTSPSAGRFVLSGYLDTHEQAEKLSDFISQNFPYLDLLEKRLIVEEDEINTISVLLQEQGFKDVQVQMRGGELTLSGTIRAGRGTQFDKMIASFKRNAGVRNVKNFVVELEAEESIIDLTDSYKVTGSSGRGGVTVNVVIAGRILAVGDLLDGMTIKEIKRDVIQLEREGVKYKIEYNK